jgi:hypothetical protein
MVQTQILERLSYAGDKYINAGFWGMNVKNSKKQIPNIKQNTRSKIQISKRLRFGFCFLRFNLEGPSLRSG